jgi:signal transduction histidine kinase
MASTMLPATAEQSISDPLSRRYVPRPRVQWPAGPPKAGSDQRASAPGAEPQDLSGRDPPSEAEGAFAKWRGQSVHLMLILFGVSVVPHLGAWLGGYRLPGQAQSVAVTLAIVVLGVVGVLVRRWPPVVRVWLLLGVAYFAAIHGLVWYNGAMARVWLLGVPILALILAGSRSGFVAAVISTVLIGLHAVAAVNGTGAAWHVAGFNESDPAVVVATSVMWVAFFIPMLILTRSVHLFHLRTLDAERAVAARLDAEVAERRLAHDSLARASKERERLEREIARVGDEERRRLGQDLHDGPCQQLAVALLRCTALENRLAMEYPDGAADIVELGELLESTMDDVHGVARSLCPAEMEPEALGPALASLARRTAHSFGVRCDYRETGEVRLPDRERTLDLYRIAQEAVNNAGKHAHAQRVTLTLDASDGHVLLTVEDDGRGVPSDAPGSGLGLRIMALRAKRMGGTLALEPSATGGTRLVCSLPRATHG